MDCSNCNDYYNTWLFQPKWRDSVSASERIVDRIISFLNLDNFFAKNEVLMENRIIFSERQCIYRVFYSCYVGF